MFYQKHIGTKMLINESEKVVVKTTIVVEKKPRLFPYFLNDLIYLNPLYPKYASSLLKVVLKNKEHLSIWLPYTGHLRSLQETQEFLKDKFDNRKAHELYLGVWIGNKLIGNLQLYENDNNSEELHLGYWVIPSQQGRGIITKGCAFLIQYAFTYSPVNKIVIACRQDNERSQAVAKRLGFSLLKNYWCQEVCEMVTAYEFLKRTWVENEGVLRVIKEIDCLKYQCLDELIHPKLK